MIYGPVLTFDSTVPVRVGLDFDIIIHRSHSLFFGIVFYERQDIREQRSDSRKCLLFRIVRMLSHAYIVFSDFFVGHLPHIFPWIFLLHRCTVRACGFFGSEILVMRKNHFLVFGDNNIHFECVDSQINGIFHGLQCIGRHKPHASPVCLYIHDVLRLFLAFSLLARMK